MNSLNLLFPVWMQVKTLTEVYKKYERWIPIVFFILGFIFDALILTRIDELHVILQQAVYLLISAAFIGFEILEMTKEMPPPHWFVKIWKYREAFLHFLLGTLLNSYTIFYFKSASSLTSLLFIVILVALLMINEFKHFGKSQTQVHMALWSLCLVSYFASLSPIIIGFLGTIAFVLGMLTATAVFYGFYRFMTKFVTRDLLRTHLVFPFAGILAIFTTLYFLHAIPPVPLSVSYLGIFHDVTKSDGAYQLSYTRPKWKFWQHGDQTFLARPGDTVFCFARVFSPTRFNDKLHVVWLYYEKGSGWTPSDSMPMPITGGREEGFRGVTKKSNFQTGQWQVRIETDDNREIGRIGFEIIRDDETEPRSVETLLQ